MSANGAQATDDAGRNDPAGAVALTGDGRSRPRRFRFRIGTLLFVIAILALLLVVIVQQVQIVRMTRQAAVLQRLVDQGVRDKDVLTTIVRELRDKVERDSSGHGSKAKPAEAPGHR